MTDAGDPLAAACDAVISREGQRSEPDNGRRLCRRDVGHEPDTHRTREFRRGTDGEPGGSRRIYLR